MTSRDPDHDHEEDDPDPERDDPDPDHPEDVDPGKYLAGTNQIPLLSRVSSQPSPRIRFGYSTV